MFFQVLFRVVANLIFVAVFLYQPILLFKEVLGPTSFFGEFVVFQVLILA